MTTPKPKEELLGEFNVCPACKGTNFLMDKLVKEAKAEGRTPEDTVACLLLMSAHAVSQKHNPLIGSLIPTGIAITDTCLDCGAIFSRKTLRAESIVMPQTQQPGTARRTIGAM